MKDFKDEIDKLMATGELDDEECVVLNVNGDCLDHHGFDKGKREIFFEIIIRIIARLFAYLNKFKWAKNYFSRKIFLCRLFSRLHEF